MHVITIGCSCHVNTALLFLTQIIHLDSLNELLFLYITNTLLITMYYKTIVWLWQKWLADSVLKKQIITYYIHHLKKKTERYFQKPWVYTLCTYICKYNFRFVAYFSVGGFSSQYFCIQIQIIHRYCCYPCFSKDKSKWVFITRMITYSSHDCMLGKDKNKNTTIY